MQSNLSNSLETEVKKVKEHVSCPIAVGFGISKREHVLKVGRFAQASIVGSFLVKCLGEEVSSDETVGKIVEAIRSLMVDV